MKVIPLNNLTIKVNALELEGIRATVNFCCPLRDEEKEKVDDLPK